MVGFSKDIAIMGISPRNSYYSDKANIEFALERVVAAFGTAYVFVPETLDRHNYLAFGYTADRALKKSRSIGHALKTSVREICNRRGWSFAENGHSNAQIRAIDWQSEIDNSVIYQDRLLQVMNLYNTCSDFRRDIRLATMASLQSRIDHNSETKRHIEKAGSDTAIDRAAHYILGEFAFLDAASAIYGAEISTYIYHREWDVYQKYIAGAYGTTRPCQKFGIINPQLARVP